MDDKTRDKLVRASAYGFLLCVCLLFAAGAVFGKSYGRLVLFTLFPPYALYYVVMYRVVCKAYEDEVKRLSAFGLIARGTFVGAIYYLSIFVLAMFAALLAATLYGALQLN